MAGCQEHKEDGDGYVKIKTAYLQACLYPELVTTREEWLFQEMFEKDIFSSLGEAKDGSGLIV